MQGGSTNGNISFFSTIAGAVFDDGDGDGDDDDDDDDDDDKPRKSVSKSSSSKGDGLSDGAGRVVRSVLSDLDDDDDDNGEDDDEPDSTQPETVAFNERTRKYHRHSCFHASSPLLRKMSEREAIKHGGISCAFCIGAPGTEPAQNFSEKNSARANALQDLPPAKSGGLDMKEKVRIWDMIVDLHEKFKSMQEKHGSIFTIIKKHQPTLVSGSGGIEVEVRHSICCFLPRRIGQRFAQRESLDDSTLMELRDLCEPARANALPAHGITQAERQQKAEEERRAEAERQKAEKKRIVEAERQKAEKDRIVEAERQKAILEAERQQKKRKKRSRRGSGGGGFFSGDDDDDDGD